MRVDEFTELAAAFQAELQAHCYRILGSVHHAEDALQEAPVRAWKGIDRFEGRASVRSWLYSIATNTALDIARHRSRRVATRAPGSSSASTRTRWRTATSPRWSACSPTT
jgi:RNA polymerase sigma-70 factor, ECF subfamily